MIRSVWHPQWFTLQRSETIARSNRELKSQRKGWRSRSDSATSDAFLDLKEAKSRNGRRRSAPYSRKGSSVPIETNPTRASVLNREIGVESDSCIPQAGSNEVSGNSTSHFFAHSLASPNKQCHYCPRCRRLSTETRNRAYGLPFACDFVASREKQQCPQFVLEGIKAVCDDEFQVIIRHGDAGDFTVEMRDGRWERDRVLFQYSRKGGIFLCRQLGQQGTYNDQNQSY